MRLPQILAEFLRKLAGKPAPPAPIASDPPESATPPPAPVIRRIQVVEDVRGALTRKCHDHGYAVARASKRRAPDAAMVKTLESWGESEALILSQSMSGSGQENQLRRLKDWEALSEQRLLDRDVAANKLDAAQHTLAQTAEPGIYPELSPALRYPITAWLTMSLAPTCHDLLTGLDPFMKWVVGAAAAAGVSVAIIYGMLPSGHPNMGAPNKAPSRRHGGFIAGVLLGLGSFGLRISGARTYGDMLLGAGLTVMELGAVVSVERKARALFAEIEGWRERTHARRLAQAHVAADQKQLDHRQRLADEAAAAVAQIDDGLERLHAAHDSKLLCGIAVSAVKAGYMKGISENAAELGGAA